VALRVSTLRPVLDFDRVEARGLVKVFGATRALSGVDASFAAGCVTAVLGPNGSGKSTLLALLSLLSRPTRGTIAFGAHDARSTPGLRGRIGVLAHAPMVYPDLNAHENLALYAELYGLENAAEHVKALGERFGLGTWASRPARTYSRGQLQRVSLARAVLHAPRLLLLDEPSTGLDQASTERLVTAVQVERARGAIVVLVTHDPALCEALADTRIELQHGRLLAASTGTNTSTSPEARA
jgi:heme exporter protein A